MDKPTITLARNKCYVDGQWVGEPKLPVTNKATGDIMARVPEFGENETRQTAHLIADVLDRPNDEASIAAVRAKVATLTRDFPVYR